MRSVVDFVNVEICFPLARVLQRDQECTVQPPFFHLQIIQAVASAARAQRKADL